MGTRTKTTAAETAKDEVDLAKATTPMIHGKIVELMKEVGAVEKKRSGHQYRYRGIEDLLTALNPALIECGLHLSTKVLDRTVDRYEEEVKKGNTSSTRIVNLAFVTLRVTITAIDGSSVDFDSAGEGMDYAGDKASNKAMSAAFKYALFLGLCVPTKELNDSDETQGSNGAHGGGDGGQGQGSPSFVPAFNPQGQAPATNGHTLTQPVASSNPREEIADAPITQEIIAEIAQAADRAGMPIEALRQAVKSRGVESSSQLTCGQGRELILAINRKATEIQSDAAFFQPGAQQQTTQTSATA